MKTFVHAFVLLAFATSLSAQVNVKFGFNHHLGNDYVRSGLVGTNDMDQEFNLHRLQYYVSQIVITHDGGTKTPVEDTYILVDAFAPEITDLGELDIDTVEAITFSVGVESPVNNEDPSQWSSTHPLAPKFPSMHWGWSAGYRFVAIEGKAGDNFSKLFEIHALGNQNYLTTTVSTTGKMVDGDLVIALDADYTKALSGISIESGLIVHGDNNEAITLLQNFRDYVYSSADGVVGLGNQPQVQPLALYPNPSNMGGAYIQWEQSESTNATVQVWNQLGQEVQHTSGVVGSTHFVSVDQPGSYYVWVTTEEGAQYRSKLVVL